jgi:hypothetical protein
MFVKCSLLVADADSFCLLGKKRHHANIANLLSMVCYWCSVHSQMQCSVQPIVGRETPRDVESKQATEALSNALQEIYNGFSVLPKMTISDVIMPSNWRVNTWNKIIYITEGIEQYILNCMKFAGVSMSTIKCCDDMLIVDGDTTSSLMVAQLLPWQNRLRTVLKFNQKW